MSIQFLGFPTTLGLPRQALRHGPEAMRSAGLIAMLEQYGAKVMDHGDRPIESSLVNDPTDVRIRKVVNAARSQAEFWREHYQRDNLMFTVGGDHSTSLGTIWALAAMGHDFDVVWVDAHGDFNVIETSPTGNPHGMVLSLACGLLPNYMQKLIDPANLHLWGIRDLDPGERALLQCERVEVLDPTNTRTDPAQLVSRLKPNVFLSFDIDSVEPDEAPGTMTPVPGGLRTKEALELVSLIAKERHLVALDIVEFHPDLDKENLTLKLALEVARRATEAEYHR